MPSTTTDAAAPLAAVVCDLGGVIVNAPFDAFTALERSSGATVGAVREINMRNPDDNAWARIERGEITVDEFVAQFGAEAHDAGHRLPARKVIELVYSLSPAIEAADAVMVEALRTCRENGLGMALITNNVRPLRDDPKAEWLFDLFDTVIESCLVGRRKPEAEIYHLALDELAVEARQTVMLDDLGINLKTARSLGMSTVKVTDPPSAARRLTEMVTRVPY
jgi:putative hydrolase of the HAD superfamily